ncbi:hypothetical protein RRG08_052603 [Elysia crispata]|uniref:Uncharacterized protein n=1 Tax=Elysia crispata TaxID=231223 RepID=A0AAE1A2N1_9GAST|nr:hypothetical protein RRG08_052603 [Elysia crispata]
METCEAMSQCEDVLAATEGEGYRGLWCWQKLTAVSRTVAILFWASVTFEAINLCNPGPPRESPSHNEQSPGNPAGAMSFFLEMTFLPQPACRISLVCPKSVRG